MKGNFKPGRTRQLVFIALVVLCTACSKSKENILPDGENNNPGNPAALAPGWYIDTTGFHTTGTFVTLIGLQKDGKIVAANTREVARFNKDGSLDQTFKPIALDNPSIHSLLIDKNDRIYIGGSFREFNGSAYSFLVRLNADGSIDNSMKPLVVNSQGAATPNITCIALQSTGKIIVGGTLQYSYYGNGDGHPATVWYDDILRLNADGTVDLGFVNAGKTRNGLSRYHAITHISVLPGDNMYVTGQLLSVWSGVGTEEIEDIARLNADGSLDVSFRKTETSFGGEPGYTYSFPLVSAILKDGTILMGGSRNASAGLFQHISDKGVVDKGFSAAISGAVVNSICLFSDDEIFVASINPHTVYFGGVNGELNLIDPNGKDPGKLKAAISKDVYGVIKESDSSILVVGNMIVKNSTVERGMLRLKRYK